MVSGPSLNTDLYINLWKHMLIKVDKLILWAGFNADKAINRYLLSRLIVLCLKP